jgi:plasmid stabilization system protein ParE
MPPRIELSRAPLADFDAIYDYIAHDNPRGADEMLRALCCASLRGARPIEVDTAINC